LNFQGTKQKRQLSTAKFRQQHLNEKNPFCSRFASREKFFCAAQRKFLMETGFNSNANKGKRAIGLKQGCQMVHFQTKILNLGKCLRALDWKMLIYCMAIWNILWPFGILYGHLVQFVIIWSIFFRYKKSGNPAGKEEEETFGAGLNRKRRTEMLLKILSPGFQISRQPQGCQMVYFKNKFLYIFEGHGVEKLGKFYGHLLYFMSIWYIVRFLWKFWLILWYIFPFWNSVPRKIWQPCPKYCVIGG
jgi:hypothetical protein